MIFFVQDCGILASRDVGKLCRIRVSEKKFLDKIIWRKVNYISYNTLYFLKNRDAGMYVPRIKWTEVNLILALILVTQLA